MGKETFEEIAKGEWNAALLEEKKKQTYACVQYIYMHKSIWYAS